MLFLHFQDFKIIIKPDFSELEKSKITFEELLSKVKKIKYSTVKTNTEIKDENKEIIIELEKHSYVVLDILYNKFKNLIMKGRIKLNNIVLKEENENKVNYIKGASYKDVLNLNLENVKITTNNILEVEKYQGIEAVRELIFEELVNTFKEQGLDVNYRHFELMSNAMTIEGVIKQIGRKGMVKEKDSILAKASFEISDKVILKAAIKSETDNFKGIFENIIIGKLPNLGTNKVKLKYV